MPRTWGCWIEHMLHRRKYSTRFDGWRRQPLTPPISALTRSWRFWETGRCPQRGFHTRPRARAWIFWPPAQARADFRGFSTGTRKTPPTARSGSLDFGGSLRWGVATAGRAPASGSFAPEPDAPGTPATAGTAAAAPAHAGSPGRPGAPSGGAPASSAPTASRGRRRNAAASR